VPDDVPGQLYNAPVGVLGLGLPRGHALTDFDASNDDLTSSVVWALYNEGSVSSATYSLTLGSADEDDAGLCSQHRHDLAFKHEAD